MFYDFEREDKFLFNRIQTVNGGDTENKKFAKHKNAGFLNTIRHF